MYTLNQSREVKTRGNFKVKLYAQIAPFKTEGCKYNLIAANGFTRPMAEDIIFDGELVIVDPQDGTNFADAILQTELESGVTKERWFELFPTGTAKLEVEPTAEAVEKHEYSEYVYYYHWLKFATEHNVKLFAEEVGRNHNHVNSLNIFSDNAEDLDRAVQIAREKLGEEAYEVWNTYCNAQY